MLSAQSRLLTAQKGVAKEENQAENPDEWTDLPILACAKLYEREGKQAKAESGRDAKGKWSGHERKECWKSLAKVVPTDPSDRAAH
jgi:hypothetical protein